METTVGLTIFVELGRVREAADFYMAAFSAEQVRAHHIHTELVAVDMRIGSTSVAVAGSNPRREREPNLGGPFSPKGAGAVCSIVQLTVPNLDRTMGAALGAGATIRDPIQLDQAGRRVASVFDLCGHIWTLIEHQSATSAAA